MGKQGHRRGARLAALAFGVALLSAVPGARSVYAQETAGAVPAELVAYPDMILFNGSVLTADKDNENFTIAQGVAVRDGKFLMVGTTAKIKSLAGPKTVQIDLKGGSVVPGFMDTHQHVHEYAMQWLPKADRHPTLKYKDLESGLQEIKAMTEGKKPGEWIATSTRPYSARALNRTNLDTVAPNNPLSIELSSEEYILNSMAMKVLTDRYGTEVKGIIKDPKTGEPTGTLRDVAAGIVQYELLPYPYPPIPTFKEILKKEMLLENSWGVTTVTTRITSEALTALNEMNQASELPLRWRVALPFPHLNPNAESFFHRLGNMDHMGDDMLRINGISFFSMDSAIGRGGAWTLKPKKQQLPGDMSGDYGVSREINIPLVALANKYGWSVKSIHSAGDKADTELLKAYADTNKDRAITDRHFGIDHGPMLTPDNVKSMAELGVIPSMQAKYVFGDDNTNLIYQYGRESLHQMTPIKSLIDAGIFPVGGADTGDEPYGKPLWNMEKLTTRTDEKGQMWGGKERIDRRISLLMYTRWAARYTQDEARLGSIEAGKLADFVVLADNYLTVPESVLSQLPVKLTVIGGKVVYDRERDGVLHPPKTGTRSEEKHDHP